MLPRTLARVWLLLASTPASATAAAEAATAAGSANKSAASDFVTAAVPVAMNAATISSGGQFGITATRAANATASNATAMGMAINATTLTAFGDASIVSAMMAAIVDASIALPRTSDEVRRSRADADVLGKSNLPPSEAGMMKYLSGAFLCCFLQINLTINSDARYNFAIVGTSVAAAAAAAIAAADAATVAGTIGSTNLDVATDAKGNEDDAAPAASALAAIDAVATACGSTAPAVSPVVAITTGIRDRMARKTRAPSLCVHSL